MIAQKYRFHSRGGVRYVYQKGRTVRTQKAALVFVPNSRGFTRIAVVISKKVVKTAVGRNRVRRRVYEALRKNIDLIPKKIDYVFIVYSDDFLTISLSELERRLGELVERSKK